MKVRIANSHGFASGIRRQPDDLIRSQQRIHEAVAGTEIEERGRCAIWDFWHVNSRFFAKRWPWLVVLFFQPQIVSAEDGGFSMTLADGVHGPGGAVEDGGIFCGGKKVEFLEQAGFVEIAEFERDEAEADPALPGFAKERGDQAIDLRLQIRRFVEALAAGGFVEVVVADADGDRARGLAFGAGFGKKPVGHPSQDRQRVGLVGDVALEGRLLGIRFCGRGLGHDRAFVTTVGEIPKFARRFSGKKRKLVRRGGGDVGDAREPGLAERAGEEGTDARQPVIVERGKEFPLSAGGNGDQGIRLAEFAGHLRDELVCADPAGERDPERLAHRPPDRRRDVLGRLFSIPAQVRIALVNGSHLDGGREVIRVAEHHAREVFVFFKIPRNHDQPRAKFPRPRHRHRRRDPAPPRLIRRRCHHAPRRPPDRDRLPPEPRIRCLLDRGKKRIGIEVENHSVQMSTIREGSQSGAGIFHAEAQRRGEQRPENVAGTCELW